MNQQDLVFVPDWTRSLDQHLFGEYKESLFWEALFHERTKNNIVLVSRVWRLTGLVRVAFFLDHGHIHKLFQYELAREYTVTTISRSAVYIAALLDLERGESGSLFRLCWYYDGYTRKGLLTKPTARNRNKTRNLDERRLAIEEFGSLIYTIHSSMT